MTTPPELPLIALTMGDACGVGPEIIVKSLVDISLNNFCIPFVIGDRQAMERALAICHSPLVIQTINHPDEARRVPIGTLPLLALSTLTAEDLIFGRPTQATGDAMFRYICAAARWCLDGTIAAMATAPISKEAMHRAGHDYPGHTELLAELCGCDDFVMMLAGDRLRVSLVTIHEALADVPALLSTERILSTIRITAAGVRQLTGKLSPRLAVLALNPHCGEGGMFGSEETEIIAPAVQAARNAGIDAVGPLSADTLFYFAAQGDYDGVVAMYHDQGLIPLKLLHFDDGVNVTLGLPIVRTSVDHGTAYDRAGTGTASERSMLAAIRMAAALGASMIRNSSRVM